MLGRTAAILAWALIAGSAVAPASASTPSPGASVAPEAVWSPSAGVLDSVRAEGSNLIRLQAGAFDPLTDKPPAPLGFTPVVEASLDATAAHYWIVQVRDERFREVVAAVQSAGALRAGVLLDDAYVVRATPAQRLRIATSPAVRWTGLLQPAWRVRSQDRRGPGLVELDGSRSYRVHLFRAEPDKDDARRALAAIPSVAVLSSGGAVVDVRATRDQLASIAAVPAVEWVTLVPELFTLNSNARWVVDTGERDLLAATRPDRLTGAGQTAAVADTAPNYKPDQNGRAHVAFRDCSSTACKEADYTQGTAGSTVAQLEAVVAHGTGHRKMAAFFDYGATGPEPHDESSHGAHTAGSVTGDAVTAGVADGDDGLAPGARLVHQNLGTPSGGLTLPDDIYDMFRQAYRPRDPADVPVGSPPTGNVADFAEYVASEDARTHNNSWGSALLGIVPTDEQSMAVDWFVWDHEDMVVVVSAGNAGPEPNTVGDPAAAKNHFDSAASANGRQPMASLDSLASFSSHGPTRDGRFGPTVATPGQIVVSAKGGTEEDYHYAQGTSMSAPVLTGAMTLVRQYFWDGYGPADGRGQAVGAPDPSRRHNPSAALVKAAAVNGAVRMHGWYTGDDGYQRELDGQWPSAGQGFGLLNLDNSLYFSGDPTSTWFHDVWRGDDEAFAIGSVGEQREYQLTVAPGAPLDVTLAYTDAPNLLPSGTPALVNNLDLTVIGPDESSYVGNNFNSRTNPKVAVAQTPATPAAPDVVNNTERVRIAAPQPGTYTVRVSAGAIADGHQGYALSASGNLADVSTTFTPGPPRQVDQAGAPVISDLAVEPVSSDMAVVRFTTNEPTRASVTGAVAGGAPTTWLDIYNRGPEGFPEYDTANGETSPQYADRPVVSTRHEVLVTGLRPAAYALSANAADLGGNAARSVPFTHTPPEHVYQPAAPDEGNLQAAGSPAPPPAPPTNLGWRTSGQMYAADGLLGAFMFRLPSSVDPEEVTGAVVELTTGHQWTIPYDEDPVFTVDLLDDAVEPHWGTQTYDEIHAAPAAARVRPETTVRDGLTRWQFTLSCADLEAFRSTLAEDGGERRAAFRYDVTAPGPGLLSVEPGFNRRSRGPQYRPRLILLTEDNVTGATAPCDPTTPPPTISDVGIHPGVEEGSVTVSWRTDVPSDSLVLFREQGTSEFVQVGSPSSTTVHQVQVRGLDPAREYEFGVRSAACHGATTTVDNAGSGWDFYYPTVPEQPVQEYWFHGGPDDDAAKLATFADPTSDGISRAATFSTDPPDGTGGVQKTLRGNPEFVANPLEAYWYAPAGDLTGFIDEDVQFAFALAGNPSQGFEMEVGVWTDAEAAGGPATKIGSGLVDVAGIGPTPQLFQGVVPVSGTIADNLVVQLTPRFLNDDGTHVFYDSAQVPSGFAVPVGDPPPAPELPTSGPVPPPSAGATSLDLASVPTRGHPLPADVAAGTGRCAAARVENVPPTAALSASPSSGEEPLVVTFDGSASTDPDDGIASWTLDYGDGSARTSGVGTPPSNQSHVFYDPGRYTATLTVQDGAGAADTASVSITVTDGTGSSNAPPRAKLSASPRSGKAPLAVRFDGSRSSDPNGNDDLASWSLDFGDGTASVSGTGPPPAEVTHTYADAGRFQATLTVSDAGGASDSATVQIRTRGG